MDVNKLVSQMTLEEKASLCSGLDFWHTKEISRLGVPSVMMTDGPHGLRKQVETADHLGISQSVPTTCFPPAVLTACSFDRSLLREMGEALGDECVSEKVGILLGPGVNIKRSPLCGRNFEYFSEDPYLAGEAAAAYINGVQSKGVGTSLKHYAANSQENRRFSSDSRVDERTLHEIYLAAFENAVKNAQPKTVMCSYNRINGEYGSENHRLLTEILRDKWGFKGFVVSDWGAVNERVKGLSAGLELEMPSTGGIRDAEIVEAVRSGELSEQTLDIAVERILNVIAEVAPKDGEAVAFDKEKHNALARRIAAESMVLLKNDGLLPLKKDARVAVIGEFAKKPRYQGAGSSQVNPLMLDNALDEMLKVCSVTYCKGYDINNCDETDAELEKEALDAARAAGVCVVFAGLPPSYESEGYDRDHMRLPEGQNRLIEAVAGVNKNVVVVLQNGSPIEMPWVDKAGAILETYLGGQAGGGATAGVLFGDLNPCGKLAESFPVKLSDNPSYLYYQGERDVTEYREGVFVGYRYYDAKEMGVLFPFGHGLSYTSFEYSDIKLSADSIKDTDSLTVTVKVKNTGSVAGKEIVQLYVGKKEKDDIVIRPVRELRGFEKVSLEPGQSATVSFTLDGSAFSYYNTQLHDRHVLSGTYLIEACKSSRDIALCAGVNVESTVKAPVRATINTPIKDILRMEGGRELIESLMAAAPGAPAVSENPEPGSFEHMYARMLPEMVLRSVMMFAPGSVSLTQLQEMLDNTLNK